MQHPFRNAATCLLLMLTLCVLFTCNMWAQGGTGELSGVVTDPSGAVVPNAQITLSNNATGDKRTTVSTGAGIYRFSALPVGTYTLEAAPTGFKSTKVTNVVVSVGTVTSRDLHLELGSTSEQVTVEAGAQLVQTTESSISQLIDRRVWEKMPLETRSQNVFINLVAGAVPQQFDNTFRGAAVNGTRTGTGNYLVEGVDNNEQGQGGVDLGGVAGGANTSISPDAIEEYRVITHDFNAEYGKAGGFVTDTVLKSGTNQWHGSLFEYNRVQKLAANDWFSNNNDIRDHLVRNQFGGSVGGPIVKDKSFFYTSAEWQRLRQSQPVTGTAFTQQFYDFVNSGAFETFMESDPNGFCGLNGINGGSCPGAFSGSSTVGPIFQSQLQKYPLAMPIVNSTITAADCAAQLAATGTSNCSGQGIYTGQAIFGLAQPIVYPVPLYDSVTQLNNQPLNQYRVSVKFDQKITNNDLLNFTYLLDNVLSTDSFGLGDATFGVPDYNPGRAQTAGLTFTHTFSPAVLNQFKVGYVRHTANFTSPGSEGIPSMITIDSLSGGFGASTAIPQFFTDNEFQYKDDLSVTKGKHGMKFGAQYIRTRNGSSFEADKNGSFWSWGGEDLITDSVFSDEADLAYFGQFGYPNGYFGAWYKAGAAVDPTTAQVPDFYRGYRANEVAFYGQDDWRITSRLTLNLGLRWEYFGPPHNFKPNIDSNFYFGTPVTPFGTSANPFFPHNDPFFAKEGSGTFQVRNGSIWNKDTNNFGPRVGFAWDAFGSSKFVIRSGFGIFYDRIYNNTFENIRFNLPYYCDCNAGILFSGVGAGPLETPGLQAVPFTNNGAFVDPALFPAGLPKATPRHMDQDTVAPYYEQWSLGAQYELGKNYALEANYIGTAGRKLMSIRNINTFDGRTTGLGSTRPNTTIGTDNYRSNDYLSNYHGLAVTLRKRFSSGLSFNANYTFSKALDDISDTFRAKGSSAVTDPQNIKLDYGPADFDIRHRFVTSFNYDLPFMNANRWLGGWSLNGIFSWNTGASIALFDSGGDYNKNGPANERPAFVGSGSVTSAIVGKEQLVSGANTYTYLDPSMFAPVTCPANVNGGLWCNSTLGRGSLHGPTFVNFDFGVGKSFKVTEHSSFTFQANFFDIFNHPNFANPQGNIQSPAFGQAEGTFGDNGGHRVTQLALRFDF
jgi:hypothetical protein